MGPAGNTPPNVAQDTISLLRNKGTSLAYAQLGVQPRPPHLFLPNCFPVGQLFGSQPVLVPWVVPSQAQDSTVLLAELHEVSVAPFLQPVKVPLAGTTTLWCISQSSQFDVISKLAEGTLCTIVQIINEEVRF